MYSLKRNCPHSLPLLPLPIEKDRLVHGLFCDGFLPLPLYYWDPDMNVTCPKCGYSWVPRSKSKFLTRPRCYSKVRNPLFSPTSTTTSTSTSTTTTTTRTSGGGTQLRELLVVLSNGRKVRLLCTQDLGACDVIEPCDLSDEEFVEALGKVYDAAFRVEEKSGDGVKVLVLSGET